MKRLVHFSACMCLILSAFMVVQAQKPELVVQTGHSDSVESIAFSPDGKTLVSGGRDGKIKLWDITTGTELRTLKASGGAN